MDHKKIAIDIVLVAVVVLGAYAAWYTYHRNAALAQIAECNYELAHPAPPALIPGPGGMLVSATLAKMCPMVVVPPSLADLIRGHVVFSDLSPSTKVNPYSLVDILLGRYTLGPNNNMPCNQSATTTDCSKLVSLPQTPPPPYVPPNPVQPIETWVSATSTPIQLFGFSLELPAGWHGAVYKDAYLQTLHALVQNDSSDRGFTIDCPPAGKGLEAATRLSSETRSFTANGTDYSIAFEKWTAPSNDPWYFLWVRTPQSGDSSNSSLGTYCLAQGTATPDIEKAMRTMYESWK